MLISKTVTKIKMQLKDSVKERRICTDFIAIFQVPQNPLKLGMPTYHSGREPMYQEMCSPDAQSLVNVLPLLTHSEMCSPVYFVLFFSFSLLFS